VLYTLAVGLGRGFWPSVAAALGCTFGIVPAAVASIVGLAAIFHTSALAFVVVKYLGVAYLLYMAWSMLGDKSLLSVSEEKKEQSYFRISIYLIQSYPCSFWRFFRSLFQLVQPIHSQAWFIWLVFLCYY